jgi:eukaryotic-like serine/threonine-protein kinase
MGEVYCARDTRLKRDVALKILPQSFAADPDRLARFQREAEVLASLNHPNIAAIYGLEESDVSTGSGQAAIRALVMELVEGETLADRITRGPIPLDEALPIAKQIAEALEAAHEQGIIHRDLKPANIKVRSDGTVKVLDFGLAKLAESSGSSPSDASLSPTITSPAMTGVGVLLGTAAYMAPEQAKGRSADKRSDIWAFGCVLFEMLTGRRAFDATDVSDTLAAILMKEPDWNALPARIPPRIGTVLRRCLQKDRKHRARDVGDVALALEGAFDVPVDRHIEPKGARQVGWRALLVALAILLSGGALGGIAVWWAARPDPPKVVRLEMATDGATALNVSGNDRDLAITPDGSRIVYRGNNRLLVRALDQLTPMTLVASVQGRGGVFTPHGVFVSPDGAWVGFFEGVALKKVAITGGPPVTLTATDGSSRGATWSDDGTIIYATGASSSGLQRISAAGGKPTVLTTPDVKHGELDHAWPEFLPGGRAVLFTIISATGRSLDDAQIAVLDLRTNTRTVLVTGGHHAHYVRTGHLVYGTGGTLRAVAFDLPRLAVTGTPVPVLDQVMTMATGAVDAQVAANGTLAYFPGSGGDVPRSLVWVDRSGHEDPTGLPKASYGWERVSPDGSRIAVSITSGGGQDVWIGEPGRGTLTRVTTDPEIDNDPIWTPDGKRLVFPSRREGGRFGFYSMAADGTGPVERLLMSEGPGTFRAYDWSPDARNLVFDYASPVGKGDIGVLSMESGHKWRPLLHSEAYEASPTLSPDGGWMAYVSEQSGRPEVYVERFPGLGDRKQISTDGGSEPVWSPDGRELFYRNGPSMTVVPIERKPTLSIGAPKVLFEEAYFAAGDGSRRYDITPDGKRFLMIKEPGSEDAPKNLTVVLNWQEELKRLVPTK